MGKPRVFISYAFVSKDHPDYLFAVQLARDLRGVGADALIDDANVGEQRHVQRLNQVLPSCQWLVVVQTPAALQSLRVQTAVSTALHLASQTKLQGVIGVIASPLDTQEIPLTWTAFPVFDASQDYPRALARILIELELLESANTSESQLDLPLFSESSIYLQTSWEDDRPLDTPRLPTSLQNDASDRDRPQSVHAHSLSPRRSHRLWFSALLVVIALAVILTSLGLFFTLSAKKDSSFAIDHAAAIRNTVPGQPETPLATAPDQTTVPATLAHSPTPSREPTPTTGSSIVSTPGTTATMTADSTPTHVLTPTATPLPALTLTVNWGSPTSSIWSGINLQRPVLVELRNNLNASDIFQQTVGTDSSGTATLQLTGIVPGVYVVLLKPQGFLRQAQSSVSLVAGSNVLSFSMTRTGTDCHTHQPTGPELWIGDANSDNVANNDDYNLIISNIDKASPAGADLNGDGVIDIVDYNMWLSSMCFFSGGTNQVVGDG